MTLSRKTARIRVGLLWSLALSSGLALGCLEGPGQDDGPCEYEDRPLEATDLTPWGVPVGEDIAALSGPYPGTWTWAPNADEILIEDADQVIQVEATFEVDESSYRLSEYVGGGVGMGVACWSDAIEADGVLSFRDQDGVLIASVPITVNRGADRPIYIVNEQISPITSFSEGLMPLVVLEQSFIRVLVNWGTDGGSPIATFEYVGQDLDDNGGLGFTVAVAEFE